MKKWYGYEKGINLGGWLSQSDYTKKHCDKFISENDIEIISKWGFDHIRLPIDYEVLDSDRDSNIADGFSLIDNTVEWCRKYNLNLILDLHKTEGYAFYLNEKLLFDSEELQQKFLDLWFQIAERYAYLGDNVAFELLNEIVEDDSSRWNILLNRAVKVIRTVAPSTKIIIGGINWNSASTLSQIEKPDDDNIIYNFHFYEPFLFTHQNAGWIEEMPKNNVMEYPATFRAYQNLSREINSFGSGLFGEITEMGPKFMESLMQAAVDAAVQADVPLYCGEYGTINFAPPRDTGIWYSDVNAAFKNLGIGRAIWTYKSMSFGISDEHYDLCRDVILKHI